MIAYRLPLATSPMDAAEHPAMKRLLPAGPWQYSEHPEGGVLAMTKRADGRAASLEDFAPGAETEDGLIYYAPKVMPTAADLIRSSLPLGRTVTLYGGQAVHIAYAQASPRKLLFGAKTVTLGDWMTEYADLVEKARDKVIQTKDWNPDDHEHQRIALLAMQQSYTVTEELLCDEGWITDADLWPILLAAAGVDPKEIGADSETSPLSAPV